MYFQYVTNNFLVTILVIYKSKFITKEELIIKHKMQETYLPLVVQRRSYKSNDNFSQDQRLDKHEIVPVNKF